MLSREIVLHIALLARLGLEKDEVEKMQNDLSAILDFFRELEQYDGQAPDRSIKGGVSVTSTARTDAAQPRTKELAERLVKNFPAEKDGYLKVRSIFSV